MMLSTAACTCLRAAAAAAGAKTQLDALQGCGMGANAAAASMKLLQLRMASSNPPLHSLWPGVFNPASKSSTCMPYSVASAGIGRLLKDSHCHCMANRNLQLFVGQLYVPCALFCGPSCGERSPVNSELLTHVWLLAGPAEAGEIWAIWRASPRPQTSSSSSSSKPASLGQQQLQLHSPLDGREGKERAAAAVLRSINSSNGLLSTAVMATGRPSQADSEEAQAAVLAALPLQQLGAGDQQQLWPQEHVVSLGNTSCSTAGS
jgi:hypothetical protein